MTDKKNDLEKISPIFSEITFSTPLELNELIEKYSSNSNLYVEIKEVFFHSIFEKFTYKNQIEKVIKLI